MNNFLETIIIYSDNILYFFMLCCLLLSFGFPAWGVSFSAGFFYGIYGGIVFALCASTTAVLVEYIICNYVLFKVFYNLKSNLFKDKTDFIISKIKTINSNDTKTFFIFVLLLKLNPLIPFAIIPLVWHFFGRSVMFLLTCNLLGAIPLASLWVFQGYSVRGLVSSNNLLTTVNGSSHSFWYYVFIFVISIVSIFVFSKLLKNKVTL